MLIKGDIEYFTTRIDTSENPLVFGSYQLKMAFLKLLDDKQDDEFWSSANLRGAYVWTLSRIIRFLKDECIQHYFINATNVFDKISCKRKQKAFIEFLEDQKRIYSAGLRYASQSAMQ